MKEKTMTVQINKAYGNASKNAKKYTVNIPSEFAVAMGITEENRKLTCIFDGERIIFEIPKKKEKFSVRWCEADGFWMWIDSFDTLDEAEHEVRNQMAIFQLKGNDSYCIQIVSGDMDDSNDDSRTVLSDYKGSRFPRY